MSHLENVSEEEINRLLGMVVDVENLFMSVHKEEDTDTKQVYFYLFKVALWFYGFWGVFFLSVWVEVVRGKLMFYSLIQGCPNLGPRAKFGPAKVVFWPTKPVEATECSVKTP